MRIAINGYFYNLPHSGQGIYLQNVFQTLKKLDNGDEYLLFIPLFSRRGRRWYKVFWEYVEFPLRCLLAKADLAFVPYFGPPIICPVPVVLTIHDLVPYIFPQYRLPVIGRIYNFLRRLGAARARLIIADSSSTKKDVLEILHLPESQVRVVYLGVESSFRQIDDREGLEELRQRRGLPEKFILYVGGFDFRKNIKPLLSAFRIINAHQPERSLVLVGNPKPKDCHYYQGSGIKVISDIKREEMPYLYNLAGIFIYPSLYEGFGLPPLEALACGIPVVVGRNSSLVELFSESAHFIGGEISSESLSSVLASIFHSDTLEYRSRKSAGLALAKKYTWEETAKCLSQIFHEATVCNYTFP